MSSTVPWSTRIYQPLADRTHYISLLTLLPTTGDEEIRCVLEQYQYRSDGMVTAATPAGYRVLNRQEGLSYTASSYAWGSLEESQYIIMINGEPFPVLRNLRNFLQEMRNSSFSGYLWIDAMRTYSDRSRTKHLRNLMCLFPHLEEPNLDLFWSTENLSSVIVECTRFLPIIYSHVNAIPAL
jgi:hypothetical protein